MPPSSPAREGLGDEGYERVKAQAEAGAALGKICGPEDIANAVCWLLEPGSLVTGQLIPVEAGALLGRGHATAVSRKP